MRDNIIDLNQYREKKQKKLKEKEYKEKQDKNEELFISITTKPNRELNAEEQYVYQEIGVICTFILKDTYNIALVKFRGVLYLLNFVGDCFEYLGKLNDILAKSLFGE